MICLKPFIKSQKCTWVRRLINNKKLQDTLAFYGIDSDLLENTGVKNIEKSMNVCTNPFWKDVLSAWKEIVSLNIEYTWEYFLNMPLWFNEKIEIENDVVFYKDWYDKGVHIVNDLLDEAGEFFSLTEFQKVYQIGTDFLKYYGLINCVKQYSQHFVKNATSPIRNCYPSIPNNIKIFLNIKKVLKICTSY